MVKCIWILEKPNSYLYVVLTSLVGLNRMFVQVMNVYIFGIEKFVLTRRVIERLTSDDTLPRRLRDQDTNANPLWYGCNDVAAPPKPPILRKVASLMRSKERRR